MRTWSRANRIGLLMTMAIGVLNIVMGVVSLPTIFGPAQAATEGPPGGVLLLDLVLGVVILAAAAYAWVKGSRRAATIASVANIFQALTAIPAFLTEAPPAWQVAAGVGIAWTTIAVALTLARSKGSPPVE